MALNKQIHVYSVDTGAFYTNNEKRLHWRLCNLKRLKSNIKDYLNEEKSCHIKFPYSKDESGDLITRLNKNIKATKNVLLHKLSRAVEYNDYHSNKRDNKLHIRVLDETCMKDTNVISLFESSLTRMLGIKTNELSTDIIVIRIFYFDILKDLIKNGFYYKGEKYRFFTSSAGQIRTKKTVFIKESLWNQYQKTIMCGLTIDKINERGGCNVNKFLAYLALTNSATDEFYGIDMHKTIVIDDVENEVNDEVDFIDDKTYVINRKKMKVPITQTDGCGLMLPFISKKNFMVRIPWVKGLLASFDFKKFIMEANKNFPEVQHEIVKDIYGKEHNILKEDIQVIFFKSQFKMYKYYSSWEEYIDCYEKYNCKVNICNVEEDRIKNSCISYQMLQSLCDTTEDELKKLISRSTQKISNVSSDLPTMMTVFHAKKYDTDKTYLQKSIEIYPELINDTYLKDNLRERKNSLVKRYKSGKLDVLGKYAFVLPDLYAVCENIFHVSNSPRGILARNQVSCRMFGSKQVDCLRSPSLFREHAIRENVRNNMTDEWFNTDAIYVSVDDLISKILQYDSDGDKLLVVEEQNFVNIAQRQMKDIVPLYYKMKKADPVILNGETIFKGLNAAYTGGNIGAYSNAISKIWNSENVTPEALDVIKLLVMENNFTID
ncbi:MAG: hypothetical protein PHN69_07890 [Candidatus Pacebacteria bacterium]|nr:hypothetical protein [Candidatus Paceibacterota bacterium]